MAHPTPLPGLLCSAGPLAQSSPKHRHSLTQSLSDRLQNVCPQSLVVRPVATLAAISPVKLHNTRLRSGAAAAAPRSKRPTWTETKRLLPNRDSESAEPGVALWPVVNIIAVQLMCMSARLQQREALMRCKRLRAGRKPYVGYGDLRHHQRPTTYLGQRFDEFFWSESALSSKIISWRT